MTEKKEPMQYPEAKVGQSFAWAKLHNNDNNKIIY